MIDLTRNICVHGLAILSPVAKVSSKTTGSKSIDKKITPYENSERRQRQRRQNKSLNNNRFERRTLGERRFNHLDIEV